MEAPNSTLDDLRDRVAASGFHSAYGITVEDAVRGHVTLAMSAAEEHLNLQGLVHGGVLATLLDTAMGLAVRSALDPGRRHVTIEMSVHYLRPAHPGRLVAHGRTLRVGRTIAFAEAEVLDEEGRALASATGTFSVGKSEPA